MVYKYDYPAHYVTVDSVVFGVEAVRGPTRDSFDLKVLLIERGLQPFRGKWALPEASSNRMNRWGGRFDV